MSHKNMSLRAKILSSREEKQLCGPAVRQLILEKIITSVFPTSVASRIAANTFCILHISADCSIQPYLRSAIKSFFKKSSPAPLHVKRLDV